MDFCKIMVFLLTLRKFPLISCNVFKTGNRGKAPQWGYIQQLKPFITLVQNEEKREFLT